MPDITEILKVNIEGILVLTYGANDTAPDPKSWPLETLLDSLTLTMETQPEATFTLVYSDYPSMDETPDEESSSYCEGCVRIEMSKMEYGQVFPAFKAVGSDDCDSCGDDDLE